MSYLLSYSKITSNTSRKSTTFARNLSNRHAVHRSAVHRQPLQKMSQKRQLFYLLAAFILLSNLIVMNDYTTYLSGAETANILTAQGAEGTPDNAAILPAQITKMMGSLSDWQPFFLRLPSIVFLLLTLTLFYFSGKKIFGKETMALSVLVLSSSLLVPNLAKFATQDMGFLLSATTFAISLFLYIKQPLNKWLIISVLALVFGVFFHPISMGIFATILSIYSYFVHPKGKNSKLLLAIGGLSLGLLLAAFFGQLLGTSGSYFGIQNINISNYFLYTFLAFLPWIAFVPAALWDMFQKMRKGEELSILTFGWLLASLLSLSIAAQAILAFLVAKQVQLYFAKNYPYEKFVKLIAVLHLVAAFCFGSLLMVNGFFFVKAVGFRAAMFTSAVYWVPTFVAIIGIYGKDKRLILGGMTLAGLLVTLFFWIQLNALFEPYRSLPKQAILEAKKVAKTDELLIAVDGFDATSNIAPYANSAFQKVTYSTDNQQITNTVSNTTLIISDTLFQQNKLVKEESQKELNGWGKDWFVEEMWRVVEQK